MALERTLFLRQQKELIEAQQALRNAANIVAQPGQAIKAAELANNAVKSIELSDMRAQENREMLDRLKSEGFQDLPIDSLKAGLTQRPPIDGEGATTRIFTELRITHEDAAISTSERATTALRNRDFELHAKLQQDVNNHLAEADNVSMTGRNVVETLGDISLTELITDISGNVIITPNDPKSSGQKEEPTPPEETIERPAKLKRGERILRSLVASFGLERLESGFPITFDEVVADANTDKAEDYPNLEKLISTFRANTRNDLRRGAEYLSSEVELNKALIDTDVKAELKKIQQDLKDKLSKEEMIILALREPGWEVVRAKISVKETAPDPEQEPDFMNTPIAIMINKITQGDLADYANTFDRNQLPPLIEYNTYRERVYLRGTEMLFGNDKQPRGFSNETFDNVVSDVFKREVSQGRAISDRDRDNIRVHIDGIVNAISIGLQLGALNENIDQRLANRLNRFASGEYSDEHILSWLTPAELGKVLKRELEFDAVIALSKERREAFITPAAGSAYLAQMTGEESSG